MKPFIHQKQNQVVIRSLEHQDLEAIEKLSQETTETQNSHQNVAFNIYSTLKRLNLQHLTTQTIETCLNIE